ncbi:MAG TPA: histone deacetylase [Myxococcales bacterium]|nr:histone deacetylase [Myxococcales bacterium]
MRVFHCDAYGVPLPPGHRFPMPKYQVLRERLLEEGTLRIGELVASEPIAVDALLLAHDRTYVDAVVRGDLGDEAVRRLGFPWSEALVQRSRASVFGTVAAARAALNDGIAGNLAGGTHHAFADHGEGYCVFNDHAVAIRLLQLEGLIERAAVVDLDVHQGNGTAALFAGDESVFTFSMHGARNYPFRKQRSSLDVELSDGCEDAEYLARLGRHLPDVLDAARADIVFYQGGVDPLAQDTLGRLRLTHEGLRARDRMVFTAARDRGIPVVLTLGGGYAKPLEASVEAHCGTYREAKAVFA